MTKELADVISRKGFTYQLISKKSNSYLYSQTLNDKIVGYEVFLRKINTQFDCVSFPSDESFGLWAWSYYDFEAAKRKFDSL